MNLTNTASITPVAEPLLQKRERLGILQYSTPPYLFTCILDLYSAPQYFRPANTCKDPKVTSPTRIFSCAPVPLLHEFMGMLWARPVHQGGAPMLQKHPTEWISMGAGDLGVHEIGPPYGGTPNKSISSVSGREAI